MSSGKRSRDLGACNSQCAYVSKIWAPLEMLMHTCECSDGIKDSWIDAGVRTVCVEEVRVCECV